jgi:hypothetical protein
MDDLPRKIRRSSSPTTSMLEHTSKPWATGVLDAGSASWISRAVKHRNGQLGLDGDESATLKPAACDEAAGAPGAVPGDFGDRRQRCSGCRRRCGLDPEHLIVRGDARFLALTTIPRGTFTRRWQPRTSEGDRGQRRAAGHSDDGPEVAVSADANADWNPRLHRSPLYADDDADTDARTDANTTTEPTPTPTPEPTLPTPPEPTPPRTNLPPTPEDARTDSRTDIDPGTDSPADRGTNAVSDRRAEARTNAAPDANTRAHSNANS